MAITEQKQVRVLVVDDSAFMRKAITIMLESDPNIKVVGSARDGIEGVEKTQLLKPDLVTMDVEMPRMDGLTALREIMQKQPTPVMMISSITTDGARAALDALELGAVDFIAKQKSYVSLDIVNIKEELLKKIKDICRRKAIILAQFNRLRLQSISGRLNASGVQGSSVIGRAPVRRIAKRNHPVSLISIGISTGGPPALQQVIPLMPRNLPVGILIAQHMPPTFTKSLAERLDNLSQLSVREAVDGEPILPGTALIAPGGQHITVRKQGNRMYVRVSKQPLETLYHPCVDVLFHSVAENVGRSGLGVVMTGMGNNGVEGMAALKAKGGICVAQDEETCVVYGMPRAVAEAGLVDFVAPVDRIADELLAFF
jgi:two-component system chemotaxis response regulator CheB